MIISGVFLILIGYAIRIHCVLKMRNFDLAVNYKENIEKGGLYKYIRHPAYVGTFTMIAGFALISSVLSVLALCFLFLFTRALQEENLLKNNPDYLEYSKKTGMFFPKLFKRS